MFSKAKNVCSSEIWSTLQKTILARSSLRTALFSCSDSLCYSVRFFFINTYFWFDFKINLKNKAFVSQFAILRKELLNLCARVDVNSDSFSKQWELRLNVELFCLSNVQGFLKKLLGQNWGTHMVEECMLSVVNLCWAPIGSTWHLHYTCASSRKLHNDFFNSLIMCQMHKLSIKRCLLI